MRNVKEEKQKEYETFLSTVLHRGSYSIPPPLRPDFMHIAVILSIFDISHYSDTSRLNSFGVSVFSQLIIDRKRFVRWSVENNSCQKRDPNRINPLTTSMF